MFRWLSIGLLSLFMIPVVVFGSLENEILLENSYTNRVQKLLDSVFGAGQFVAKVDVSLTEPKYEVKYTRQSDAKLKKNEKTEKTYILPGYQAVQNIAPNSMKQLPFDSVTTYISPKLRRINVDVKVSKSVSRSLVGRARGLIKESLGMRDKRDKINIQFVKFYAPKPVRQDPNNPTPVALQQEPFFTPNRILLLGLLAVLLAFLLLYVYFQRQGITAMGAGGGGNDGGGDMSPNINITPNFEVPEGGSGGPGGDIKLSEGTPIKQYFDFVTSANIDKLVYILKKESLNVENIAVLVSFLSPKLASRVIKELDTKEQSIIAVNMLTQRMINRSLIEKFEGQIRNAMECLTGGEGAFERTFQYIPSDTKKSILAMLKTSNPTGYTRYRQHVILFDDLIHLDDEDMKTLVSEVDFKLLSRALVGVEQVIYDKISQSLTSNVRPMLQQFIELKGAGVTKEDQEQAQEDVLKVVLRLEKEGKLRLREKIKS